MINNLVNSYLLYIFIIETKSNYYEKDNIYIANTLFSINNNIIDTGNLFTILDSVISRNFLFYNQNITFSLRRFGK